MTIAITTAGRAERIATGLAIARKDAQDRGGNCRRPQILGRIFGAAPDDDPSDLRTWIKANPSLKENGGFLDIEKVREKYISHLAEGDLTSFKRYYLNIWDQKEHRAIDLQKWDASAGSWTTDGLLPKCPGESVRTLPQHFMKHFAGRRCWAGVDLSMTTDLTAVSFVFPSDDGGYDVLPFFWIPENGIRRRELRDGMPYTSWVNRGYMESAPGDVIDYRDVKARLSGAGRSLIFRKFVSTHGTLGRSRYRWPNKVMFALRSGRVSEPLGALEEATGIGGERKASSWRTSGTSLECELCDIEGKQR